MSLFNLCADIRNDPRFAGLQRSAHIAQTGYLMVTVTAMMNQPNAWLTPIIAGNDCFVTSTKIQGNTETLIIEPLPGFGAMCQPPQILYHVTQAATAATIMAGGIVPQAGGNTWMNRTYPARSHFAPTLWEAFIFMDSRIAQRAVMGPPGALTNALLAGFEVITFAPQEETYYPDLFFPPSLWTDATIDAGRLQLHPNWRAHYQSAAAIR